MNKTFVLFNSSSDLVQSTWKIT